MKKQTAILFITTVLFCMTGNISFLFGNIPNNSEIPSANIYGRIVDSSTGIPLEYVSVAVFRSSDSSLITGTLTDLEGKFKFGNMNSGDYYLRINCVGFEKTETPIVTVSPKNTKTDVGDIRLAPSKTMINEVVVSAEKPRVEYKIDKRVINVDKDINAKGGTAVNVLENTPSVQVDPQGNVTLRGSSDYIVLIDGKPSILKGSDALKQLPASAIKQIEVITNPSAKYDAEGQAGIINVVMKKEKLEGLNGNINMAAGTTEKRTSNLLANYRHGKFNFFTGLDYADNKYSSDINLNNITMLSADHLHTKEEANQFNKNNNMTVKGGLDFDLNEKNTFTASASFGRQGYDNGTNAQYHIWNISNTSNRFSTSSNFMDVTGDVLGLNADYTHKFADNHTFSITNSYTNWDGMDNNDLNEIITDENFNKQNIASKLNFNKDNYNFHYRCNIDYKRPLFTGSFETGAQYRLEDRDEDFTFSNYNISDNSFVRNDSLSYILKYINAIYSGYTTYSDKILGIGYQLGLRSEVFLRSIDISNMGGTINFNKFMFYPTVHLSKDINEKHQFQLSYSRRINRPQPWLLNNTPSYVDPNNIFKGSPYLKPEYTDAFEFNYRTIIKQFTVSTQTYFRNTTNLFTALRLLQPNGIMYHQLTNAKSQQAYGVELGLDVNLFKWWTINSGANIYHYTLHTLVTTDTKTQSVNTWDARLVSNFNMKWGTRIQAIGYYRAPNVDAQGKASGFYTSNLAISQSLMKGKVNLGVSAQNILNSIDFDYTVKSNTFNNNYNIIAEGPIVMVNFSYTFNNFQYKNRGRADDTVFKGGGAF